MIKTQNDIERDFYQVVSNSTLGKSVSGKIYREGMRPDNPTKEDIIVTFLSGIDGQIQEGIVLINVFIPDIPGTGGKIVENKKRVGALQAMKNSLIDGFRGSDYYITRNMETPRSIAVDGIKQHCFTIRLAFKLLTD